MICPDCLADGQNVTCLFDAKQMGEVCPNCERVFSMMLRDPMHKHYASEKGYRRRIERDKKERLHRSVSTQALVSRILKPID